MISTRSRLARARKGFALIVALGAIAVVAALAGAAIARQSRLIQAEESTRDRDQAALAMLGAMDWARLILRQDAQNSRIDHLGEPWAVGIHDLSLSSFISMSPDDAGGFGQASMSGSITDATAKLNAFNLAAGGAISEPDAAAFEWLFNQLGLPPSELQALRSAVVAASASARSPRQRTPTLGAWVDLRQLGVSQASAAALEPYVEALPQRTALNVNTAPALALMAMTPGLDAAKAQSLTEQRLKKPFSTVAEFTAAIAPLAIQASAATGLSVSSSLFIFECSMRAHRGTLSRKALLWRAPNHSVKTLSIRAENPLSPEEAWLP